MWLSLQKKEADIQAPLQVSFRIQLHFIVTANLVW